MHRQIDIQDVAVAPGARERHVASGLVAVDELAAIQAHAQLSAPARVAQPEDELCGPLQPQCQTAGAAPVTLPIPAIKPSRTMGFCKRLIIYLCI